MFVSLWDKFRINRKAHPAMKKGRPMSGGFFVILGGSFFGSLAATIACRCGCWFVGW